MVLINGPCLSFWYTTFDLLFRASQNHERQTSLVHFFDIADGVHKHSHSMSYTINPENDMHDSRFVVFCCGSLMVDLLILRAYFTGTVLAERLSKCQWTHYDDVIMSAIASRIASLTTVYLIVYSRVDQRRHQSSASLAFVRGIHRRPVNSPHKGPVTRKMVPFDDVIMHPRKIHTINCMNHKKPNIGLQQNKSQQNRLYIHGMFCNCRYTASSAV